MEALKFTLSGKTAFFKRPEMNQKFYFTFSHIHKIALLGIFGCILGLDGYNQQTKEDEYPEFYKELKDIKVAISPKKESKGIFPMKIQAFNNSVGYASKEDGNNLVVREQILEDVEWDIFVLCDSPISKELATKIRENRTVFTPYLGKNEHLASITNIEDVTLEINNEEEFEMNSLCLSKEFASVKDDERVCWYVRDRLPVALNEDNFYVTEKFVYTNSLMKKVNLQYPVYSCKYGNIDFI